MSEFDNNQEYILNTVFGKILSLIIKFGIKTVKFSITLKSFSLKISFLFSSFKIINFPNFLYTLTTEISNFLKTFTIALIFNILFLNKIIYKPTLS